MNINNRNNGSKNTQQKTASKNPKLNTPQLLGIDQRMNNGYINLPTNRRSFVTNSNQRDNQTATNVGRYAAHDVNNRNLNQVSGARGRSMNDAPTSLSNLAQLSGITLLPVSNQRHVSSNTAKNQHVFSVQALQQFRDEDSSNEKSNSNVHRQELELGFQRRGTNIGGVNYGASNSRTRSDYNLSAIPSVQLLNQTMPTNGGKLPSYNDVTSRDVQKSQRNIRVNRQPNTFDNRARVNKVSDQTDPQYDFNQKPILLNSDIQLIPVSSNYSAGNVADSSLQHVDASLSASGSDSELGMTNESLLHLMAVFSNPALTITPIDSQGNIDYVEDDNLNDSVGEATISAATLPIDNAHQGDIIYNPGEYESTNPNVNSRVRSNNRMPKSAANLQMIFSHDSSQQSNPMDSRFDRKSSNQSESSLNYNYGQATTSPFQSAQLDYEVADYPMTDPLDEIDGPLDAKNYEMISNSIRDLIMEKCNRNSSAPPTISVQLIRELASQAKDTSQWIESESIKAGLQSLGRGTHKSSLKELGNAVKLPEVTNLVYVNEQALMVKGSKRQLKTSKYRLYELSPTNKFERKSEPTAIFVEKLEPNRQTYLSERHEMVESLRPVKRRKLDHNGITDEQGSSSERMERPISKIASTLERWRRIDATNNRSSDRMQPSAPDFDDLGYLNFYDYDDTSKILNRNRTVSVQLPSEDVVTDEKRAFMDQIGLVTRYQRSKLRIDECEKKLRVYSALALESKAPVSDDAKRFVRMINQTGGTDIQLRVDTDIKRNDLPLIEGLNRNSSRTKMSYMSALGLDKRSKRTTLYKLGKITDGSNLIQEPKPQLQLQQRPQLQLQQRSQLQKQQQQQYNYHDRLQLQQQHQQQQQRQLQVQQQPKQVELNQRPKHQQSRQLHNDLSNKKKPMTNDNRSSKKEISTSVSQDGECSIIPMLFGFDNITRPPLSKIAVSCREAMNKPSKQDYMKSLGLISS